MIKYLLIVLAGLLVLPNFFDIDLFPVAAYNKAEQFDASLSNLNTVEKLEEHIDSTAEANAVVPGSIEYVETISNVLSNRFYHGYSHFSLQENWLAVVAAKLFKYDYACKVNPEGIVKHEYAACSQQAVVMMALLRRKEIPYRSILFPHHYALEVQVDNKWYYFDTNKEPVISIAQREENNWHQSADSLKKYYDPARYKNLDYDMGIGLPLKYGTVNEIPASNALIFETITGAFSKVLWCIPLLLIFFHPRDLLQFFKKTKKKSIQQ